MVRMDERVVLGRSDSVCLARRGDVHELIVNGAFAMDSVEVTSELELARQLGTRPGRVLVGGLGLGFTTAELLRHGASEIVVVELSGDLVGWAREGLTPQLGDVAHDPRVTLVIGDVTDALSGQVPQVQGPFDAILLDVDNGPSFLIHEHNGALYAERFLSYALGLLRPGGTLGVWCEEASPELAQTLAALGPTREVIVPVEREDRQLHYALYFTLRG